jgi:hypothetical protein
MFQNKCIQNTSIKVQGLISHTPEGTGIVRTLRADKVFCTTPVSRKGVGFYM